MADHTAEADFSAEEVARLEQEHMDLLMLHDLDGLDRMFADDYLHIHYDGRREDKQAYLKPLRENGVRYTRLEWRGEPVIHALGPAASCTCDMYWVAEADGETVDGTITCTSVWARRGADAVLLTWHSSPSARAER